MDVQRVHEAGSALAERLNAVVLGQPRAVQELVIALLAGGHVLLEGPPGLGKTLLVHTLARAIAARFSRIQFTPDLMPADVTGTAVLEPASGELRFRPGPLFTEILLADEINRTPPKTQAALLEAMQERQVTAEGVSRPLPPGFFVAATQNPVEYEGTYPLPEAQLDRFFMMVRIDYPDALAERAILDAHADRLRLAPAAADTFVEAVLTLDELFALREVARAVHVDDSVRDYLVRIVRSSREHRRVALGASSRASVSLLFAAKVAAAVAGRDYVRPDDVKQIAPAVLRHRLLLRPDAEIEGIDADQVVAELLAAVEVHAGPREASG